eukprot:1147333-Pelagomonas_calceolata.AAC.2
MMPAAVRANAIKPSTKGCGLSGGEPGGRAGSGCDAGQQHVNTVVLLVYDVTQGGVRQRNPQKCPHPPAGSCPMFDRVKECPLKAMSPRLAGQQCLIATPGGRFCAAALNDANKRLLDCSTQKWVCVGSLLFAC